MSWLTKILSSSVGSVVNQVGDVVDRFHLSGEEKQKFKLEMEALLQKRSSEIEATIRSELQAKERVLVAELTQGDKYTKPNWLLRKYIFVEYSGPGMIARACCCTMFQNTFTTHNLFIFNGKRKNVQIISKSFQYDMIGSI